MPDSPDSATLNSHDPYAPLRLRDYRLFLGGSTLAWFGLLMQSAAVGWEISERKPHQPLYLGLVGLVQILPVLALSLAGGHVADRFDRRRVLMVAESLLAACSVGLALVSFFQADIRLIYLILFLIGIGRAFQGPAKSALLPQIVPREIFSNAVTWNSGAFQLASVSGPAAAGLLIALFNTPWFRARLHGAAIPGGTLHGTTLVFLLDALGTLSFLAAVVAIRARPVQRAPQAATLKSLAAGGAFVWNNKLILSAITLDLFAVLLGGAVALMPIYARDILQVGALGYGCMMAAPAVGALLTSLVLAHRPPMRRAGRALLWSVAGFGAATVVFGISRSYPLSLAMLFLTGAFDNISVVVRHTLVQVLTPDEMRGRVSAVNGMFIGASNELGGFESGALAAAVGPTFSVVFGGLGTMLVVGVVTLLWPQLRAFGRLDTAHAAPVLDPEEAGAVADG